MPLLRPGDPFPELIISTIGGPALTLPDAVPFTVGGLIWAASMSRAVTPDSP